MALELHKLSMEDNERDEQYLALHGILDIFQSLTKALIVKQPEKVYDFLIDELKTISQDKLGKQHVVFMMGGGDQRAGLCQRLAEEFGFQHIVAEQALKGAAAGGDTHAVAAALQTALKPLAEGAVVLLDGFPRNMKEALHFEIRTMPCRFAVHLEGAGEDADQTPVLAYYGAQQKLAAVGLGGNPDETYEELRQPFLQMLQGGSPVSNTSDRAAVDAAVKGIA